VDIKRQEMVAQERSTVYDIVFSLWHKYLPTFKCTTSSGKILIRTLSGFKSQCLEEGQTSRILKSNTFLRGYW